MDTMTRAEDVLASLNKDILKKIIMASEVSKNMLPTASFGINVATGGGLPVGKQTTIWGGQSAGKSSLLLQTVGINQKRGVVCAWIDAEKTLDKEWARRLGVDTDQLLVSHTSGIGDMTDVILPLIRGGVGLIVVDSTSSLMPNSFFDGNELKNFDGTKQLGQAAAELGKSGRMIQSENFTCALVHISQVRMDLSGMHASHKYTGGKEVEHQNSLTVKLTAGGKDSYISGIGHGGYEEKVGRVVKWEITKNKVNGRMLTGGYDFYTQTDEVGVDYVGEVFDQAKKAGVISGSTWVEIYGEKFNGKTKTISYIKENPEILAKLESDLGL